MPEQISDARAALLEKFFAEYGVFAGDPDGPVGEFSTVVIANEDSAMLATLFAADGAARQGVEHSDLPGRYLVIRKGGGFSATRFDSAEELDAATARCADAHNEWVSARQG